MAPQEKFGRRIFHDRIDGPDLAHDFNFIAVDLLGEVRANCLPVVTTVTRFKKFIGRKIKRTGIVLRYN